MRNETDKIIHFPTTIVKIGPNGEHVLSDYLNPGEETVDPVSTRAAQSPGSSAALTPK